MAVVLSIIQGEYWRNHQAMRLCVHIENRIAFRQMRSHAYQTTDPEIITCICRGLADLPDLQFLRQNTSWYI